MPVKWYRKKPDRIRAIQYTGDNVDEIRGFCDGRVDAHAPMTDSVCNRCGHPYNEHLVIDEPNGPILSPVCPGLFVVENELGFKRLCEADKFYQLYEEVRI